MPKIATGSRPGAGGGVGEPSLLHHPTIHIWSGRDRFVLGYGPSPVLIAAALCRAGDLLDGPWPSPEGWQPDADAPVLPGLVVTVRAPGQALSMANGMALAARLSNQHHRVFALLNEPECLEGQVWEAALAAAHQQLDNVVVVIDLPGVETESRCLASLASKWRAFGWQVMSVNGHDPAELRLALAEAESTKGRPSVVLARTVPGRGVSLGDDQLRPFAAVPDVADLVRPGRGRGRP